MTTLHQGTREPSGTARGDLGVCQVCGATYKLVSSTGLLFKHGHGHNRPPCAGSGCLPVPSPSPDLDVSADLFGTPDPVTLPVAGDPSLQPPFALSPPPRPTIRRIPRGARINAAQALESSLRALLSSPDD